MSNENPENDPAISGPERPANDVSPSEFRDKSKTNEAFVGWNKVKEHYRDR